MNKDIELLIDGVNFNAETIDYLNERVVKLRSALEGSWKLRDDKNKLWAHIMNALSEDGRILAIMPSRVTPTSSTPTPETITNPPKP